METFWFFWLRFRRTYDSDFWFSLGHKRSYDTAYDSEPTPTSSLVVKTSLNDLNNNNKKKHRSHKRSYKRDGIGVRWIRAFPFLPTSLTIPSLMFRLCCSENQIFESRSGGINKSQCTFPRFLIGLVLLLLLVTPTIWFSPDHWQNVSYGVVSRIKTLFHYIISSTLLITTATPTPVWPFEIKCW